MAITSQDGLVAAVAGAQSVVMFKGSRTTTAAGWFTTFDLAGNPGAGALAGTSTTAGVVPTDATAGYPPVNAFGGSNLGYLTAVDFGNTVASRIRLVDVLFKAGAYAFNANVTLSAQPSYASRAPGGDYKGTELWVECVTAFTGSPTITITYTNQDGVTGRSTGAVAVGITVGRLTQISLQAGDTGIQKIESVVGAGATAGTFNVLVVRQLWTGRVRSVNDGDTHGPDKTDLTQLFADSAIALWVIADSTASGVPECTFGIGNG